jgi:hypothetical protein
MTQRSQDGRLVFLVVAGMREPLLYVFQLRAHRQGDASASEAVSMGDSAQLKPGHD